MGALKQGLLINVVTKNRCFAENFISKTFNKPDKISNNDLEFVYLYENGDRITWLYPREYCRGNKCNLLYYDDTVGIDILNNVFVPAMVSPETYMG